MRYYLLINTKEQRLRELSRVPSELYIIEGPTARPCQSAAEVAGQVLTRQGWFVEKNGLISIAYRDPQVEQYEKIPTLYVIDTQAEYQQAVLEKRELIFIKEIEGLNLLTKLREPLSRLSLSRSSLAPTEYHHDEDSDQSEEESDDDVSRSSTPSQHAAVSLTHKPGSPIATSVKDLLKHGLLSATTMPSPKARRGDYSGYANNHPEPTMLDQKKQDESHCFSACYRLFSGKTQAILSKKAMKQAEILLDEDVTQSLAYHEIHGPALAVMEQSQAAQAVQWGATNKFRVRSK